MLKQDPKQITKVPTRIPGLDEVLEGGLPEGRTTLINGAAGTGKTVLGLEFLYNQAVNGTPVMFVTFEEPADVVRKNASSMGWDLAPLENAGKFFLWHAELDPDTFISGSFNIGALLAILKSKAEQFNARIIMIDAVDVLMTTFEDSLKEKKELYRLHKWFTDQQFTAVLTTKVNRRSGQSTRYEFLDFMADCVLLLDLRVVEQVATRRIRVLKYRGSGFSSNEYPYIITARGNVVMPVTAVKLADKPIGELMTSGNKDFDKQLGGGYHKGSCIAISGPTGSGKTTLASTFTKSACSRGCKVIYISFEESEKALMRAMLSPGIDLQPAIESGKLQFHTIMPEALVFEEHLYGILQKIESFKPEHIIVDAISACNRMGSQEGAFDFIIRLISICKQRGITCLMTNQVITTEGPVTGIASIIDTLVSLFFIESDRERRRNLVIIKSRAAHHSHAYHQYSISDNGICIDPKEEANENF